MDPANVPVKLVVEGPTDEAILRRVLELVGVPCGSVYGRRGKAYIEKQLSNYNQAARWSPWLVVVDLDKSAPCAPLYVRARLPNPSSLMHFRLAVRATEAWLLADAERLADFLGIPPARVPPLPDTLDDPKRALVDLARRSRTSSIKEDMVPRPGSHRRVGPGYPGRIIQFVTGPKSLWRPDVAASNSDSLRRCIQGLCTLTSSTVKP